MSNELLPYELSFDERPGYLYACVTAPTIDRRTALAYLGEVAKRATASKYDRLMLERDIPVMLPSADLFFTTRDFLDMIGHRRVAFVNKHADIHAEMDFAMMVGTNRGANYKLFREVDDAEEWLLARKAGK